jgi:glyoxylase-like metal-dependent hydrolase (beta-lactamase superfamily II)
VHDFAFYAERVTRPWSVQETTLARRVLAPNPGPMTLDGTNSYVVRKPGSPSSVIVDPGPLDEEHLARLAAGNVDLILLTHWHLDHSEAARDFGTRTGAPVRAIDPAYCVGAAPLVDGELVEAAGVLLRVVATPGHTADSACFHLPDDGPAGSLLTGDTVLGRGTTIIDHPGGRLADYLGSLRRLQEFGPATVLPAHGPVLPDLAVIAAAYLEHRAERLAQISAALDRLGRSATVAQVADAVYGDVDPSVRRAAEASVAAQLEYLLA